MKDYQVQAITKQLYQILDFVTGKTKEYKYNDYLNKTDAKIFELKDLPCEFFLLLGSKSLISKPGSLHSDITAFIRECNNTFEYFTGDHLYPVPNSKNFNKESFNATLAHYAMKRNGSLWVKKSGEVRIEYIKHLLSCLNLKK